MKIYKWLLNIIIITGLYGCSDIVEMDITRKNVTLISPKDSVVTPSLTPLFYWNEVEGAKEYVFQIAYPDFDNPTTFYADTVITDTTFSIDLEPGLLQWRVQAINNGYRTGYALRTLSVDTTADLSSQTITLTTPTSNQLLNTKTVDFSWKALTMADKYLLEILSPVQIDTLITTNSVSLTFSDDDTYTWKVTALNSISLKESATGSFVIDTGVPTAPTLVSPAHNVIITGLPISFSWTRNASDIDHDMIYIYDSSFQLLTGFPKTITGTTYSLTSADATLTSGDYFWAVKSVDNAGNISDFSVQRKFTLP